MADLKDMLQGQMSVGYTGRIYMYLLKYQP